MRKTFKALSIICTCGCPLMASAQLAVTVWPPKLEGQKIIIPLALKNNLTEKVDSGRAVAFLLDEQGKVVGQATRWVIGGNDAKGLAAGETNAFFFVIGSDKPFTTTNLSAKVTFTRVVLQNGNLADAAKDVIVTTVREQKAQKKASPFSPK